MHNDRLYFEKQLWSEGYKRIMGLDEVGRGCLAGPVVAAGVILPPDFDERRIRDSKQMAEQEREELAGLIKAQALFWTIQEGSLAEINKLNILWASIKAMQKCVEAEGAEPDYLLVDGNRFTSSLIPYTCIVKGDNRSQSIGAASILAKVYRDKLMRKLAIEYPEFDWESNVGYPTPRHKQALIEYGYTRYHRSTFTLGTQKEYRK